MAECKCILTAVMARYLVKQGFRIVDIKPQKENPDRTVFVFENSDELKTAMSEYNQKDHRKELNYVYNS
jgi:hypothetical protein